MKLKERVRVLLFYPRFVLPILDGRKRQTIRRDRKSHPIAVGDRLSLRRCAGMPYRSNQVEIRGPVTCSAVLPVRIEATWPQGSLRVWIGGMALPASDLPRFARADGFTCVGDMLGYYRDADTTDFSGVLIEWNGGSRCP
jgi:hypothetical protein